MSVPIIEVRPVILCGGSGTRLWPLSRAGFPKQFLCLTSDESLFQQAAKRLMGLVSDEIVVGSPYVVTNEEHRFLVVEQLREAGINLGAALLEPSGRNTAPALALAALAALESGVDPVLAVSPSDQTVVNEPAFNHAMHRAIHEAASGSIVILGVAPDHPASGYGYIQTLKGGDSVSPLAVSRFIEKPDLATARSYLNEGNYFWNAGIFVVKASIWMAALESFRPDIAKVARFAWAARTQDTQSNFIRPGKDEFMAMPSASIDYAVMEPLSQTGEHPLKMVRLDAGWNDLGAWDAVWAVLDKDDNGNAHTGNVLTVDSRNTLVKASNRMVSLVGVKNLIVIETADAVLVADRSRSQDVKQIVSLLQDQGREEHNLHRKVYRPWGWYDSIDEDERFKVKRIQVKPHASLSLQKHIHRSEHWIVVKGTAEITCGDKVILLTENQSTYIPLGEIHRLTNPGATPLEIIEVQTGDRLDEADIIRVEDKYGRA